MNAENNCFVVCYDKCGAETSMEEFAASLDWWVCLNDEGNIVARCPSCGESKFQSEQ
jgi:hypothetical protein